MIVLIAHNLAPLMFVSMVLLLLIGYPIAFSLAATGIVYFIAGIALAPYAPTEISLTMALAHIMPDRAYAVLTNEILLALPFFTFMGLILERSGMAEDLLSTVGEAFGRAPGGIAYSVIFVGALLAASTGVVAASIIAMGLISLPIMLRYGYSRRFAAGVIIASGTLAQIIPPSIVLIVLADQLGRPVGDMYQGALLPGLLLAAIYAVWVMVLSVLRPAAVPGLPEDPNAGPRGLGQTLALLGVSALTAIVAMRPLAEMPIIDTAVIGISIASLVAFCVSLGHRYLAQSWPAVLTALALSAGLAATIGAAGPVWQVLSWSLIASALYLTASCLLRAATGVSLSSDLSERVAFALVPPLLLIFLVLGTIFIGVATPTEGGAMGAVGAVVLALVKRRIENNPKRLSLRSFTEAAEATARLSAFVMFILIGSRIFSMTFYAVNGHIWVEELLSSLPGGEFGFLLFVLGLIFILGFFLEFFEIAFVVVPLIVPAAETLGIDMIWFGVLLALVVQTSYLTPPLGFGLFFLRSVAPSAPYVDDETGQTIPALSTGDIYRGVAPFVVAQCLCIALVVTYPALVTHYRDDDIRIDPEQAESDLRSIPLPSFD